MQGKHRLAGDYVHDGGNAHQRYAQHGEAAIQRRVADKNLVQCQTQCGEETAGVTGQRNEQRGADAVAENLAHAAVTLP